MNFIFFQAETLQGSENIAIQMNLPSQIINATSDGSDMIATDVTDNLDLPEIINKGQ